MYFMDAMSIAAYTCLSIYTHGLKIPAVAYQDCMTVNLLLVPMGRGDYQCVFNQKGCRSVSLDRYRLIRQSCFLISSVSSIIDLVTICPEQLIALSIDVQEDK